MNKDVEKPNRQRWGPLQWGTAAFLVYLWGWLVLWCLFRLDALTTESNYGFREVVSLIYLPIIMLGRLIDLIR